MRKTLSALAALFLTLASWTAPLSAAESGPLVERWNFSGGSLDELRASAAYPDSPASRWHSGTVDIHDLGDYYALRVRGTVVAPADGEYTFWLCSDDQGELWLSPDAAPAGARRIAWLDEWAPRGEFTRHASQKSAPVTLRAGERRYFEALMREGNGGDHLQLAWSLNGGARELVPASCLEMFTNGDTAAPTVPEVSALRLSPLVTRFSWPASTDATGVWGYRVYRDGRLVREQAETAFAVAASEPGVFTVAAVDFFGNVSAPSAPLSAAAAADANPGHGLLARYYNGRNFGTLASRRVDPCVNFNWGAGRGDAAAGENDFAVRWEGTVTPRHSGEYTFTVTSDDGARLWIDGRPVIDQWVDQSSRAWSGKAVLTAGRAHEIRLEYFENGGDALCRLTWKSAEQPEEIVPEDRLTPRELTPDGVAGSGATWTGLGLDNLWSNPANWSLGVVPAAGQDVVFSGLYPRDCFVDADVDVRSLTAADGYANSLLASGRAFRVSGDLDLSGVSGGIESSCTLELRGAEAQSVRCGGNQKFAAFTVGNHTGRVTFNSDIHAGTFTAAPGATLAFTPGVTLYADSLSLRGTEAAPVRLGAAATGDSWKVRLIPGGSQEISWVEVAGSDASASAPLDATRGGRDYGGNRNWVFDTAAAVTLTADQALGVLALDGTLNGAAAESLKVYVNGVQVPVQGLGEYRWNAAADLNEGENRVKVLNGEEVILEKDVVYTAGDVTGSVLTVRAGDGMFLAGEGGLGPRATVLLDLDGDGKGDTPAFADGRFARTPEPGEHVFTADIDRNRDGRLAGDGELAQKITVRAVSVNWRADARGHIACQQGFTRVKNDVEIRGAGLDDIVFTASNPVACVLTATGGSVAAATATAPALATPALTVLPLTRECPVLQARWGSERGPVIAECGLDVFNFWTTASKKIMIVRRYPDGSALTEGNLVLNPHVPGLDVKVHIFVWGATFMDSSVDASFNTDAFTTGAPFTDGDAGMPYRIIMTRERLAVHGPCHNLDVYQGGVKVGAY